MNKTNDCIGNNHIYVSSNEYKKNEVNQPVKIEIKQQLLSQL